ncbi:MFS transporter [Chloroflexota bacterium]
MAMSSKQLKPPWYPWIGRRPFYGWIIVIIGAVTQFFQGIASQGFTTYMGPLQSHFGWSKAVLASPRSVTQIEGAIIGPLEGFLIDRFGPRRVVATGIFIMGLGFILFGQTQSLWMYYLASIIIALGTGLQGQLVMSVAVNNWFSKKRTIAQSVMGLGYSMAGVAAVPALVYIQKQMDWQSSAFLTGLLIWVVGFPLSMLLRTRPEVIGSIPDGGIPDLVATENDASDEEYDFTLREAIRTRAFWLLACARAIGNIGIMGIQVHLFLHLEEGVGLSRTIAALVWMVASLSNIPSRLLGGFFGDRLPKKVILGIAMIFMAVAMYLLAIAVSTEMAFAYAVLLGIGWGIQTPLVNAIQGEYFGRKSQGIIRGWLQTLSLPINIAVPLVAGYMADVQGTYRPTFTVIALVIIVGSVMVFLTTRPKPTGYRERLA